MAAHALPVRKPLVVTGAVFSWAHFILGGFAFVTALSICLSLHYERVVKNHVAGYPDEWWPSVSATIGDWFPERNVFQILCAATAGFRLIMVSLCGLLACEQGRLLGGVILTLVGILRTFSCGGWIFITSTDHALVHDLMMGLYLVFTPFWMALSLTQLTPKAGSPIEKSHRSAQLGRKISAFLFYACTPFMVYFYLKHRRDEIPGMYTYYSMLEWSLVALDLIFDASSAGDLKAFSIQLSHSSPQTIKEVSSPASDSTFFWVLAQAFLAFTGWSALFALTSMIFYFSVFNMAAEGLELLVLSPFLGLVLVGFTPLQRLFRGSHPNSVHIVCRWRQALFWLASLATVASYVIPSPMVRLLLNAFSCAVIAVIAVVEWSHGWEAGRLAETMASMCFATDSSLASWVCDDAC